MLRLFTDRGIADDTVSELSAYPADVVVVDCMLPVSYTHLTLPTILLV